MISPRDSTGIFFPELFQVPCRLLSGCSFEVRVAPTLRNPGRSSSVAREVPSFHFLARRVPYLYNTSEWHVSDSVTKGA